MKDYDLATRREIEIALLVKGQKSKRYKLGEIWELNYDEIREALDELTPSHTKNSITEDKVIDDTISRKTVINGLDYIITELDKLIKKDPLNNEYHHTKKQVEEIKNGVQNLPPTQPEREKGEWILVTDNNGQHYECSQCGAWRYHQEQFCGSCGADMR